MFFSLLFQSYLRVNGGSVGRGRRIQYCGSGQMGPFGNRTSVVGDAGAIIALLTQLICFTPFHARQSRIRENLIIGPPRHLSNDCSHSPQRGFNTFSQPPSPSFYSTYFRPSFLSLLYYPSFSPPNFSTYTLTTSTRTTMSPRTRPLVATAALGFICFFLWSSPFSGPNSRYYRDVYDGWRSPDGQQVTLAARLHEEDLRYAATIKARQGLIQKHGPSKEEVHS